MEDRVVKIALKLSDTLKNFKYKNDADMYDDVFHDGYSARDVLSMGTLNLPKGMENLEQIFPEVVGRAMEDAERSSIANEINKRNIQSLEEALLKIDVGFAEYQDLEGKMISAKAAVMDVEIDEASDSITVSILNPEHLINAMLSGEGMFSPDLPSEDAATSEEIIARFHHLEKYFDIYGERKPRVDLDRFDPSYDDDFFSELIKENLENLSLTDVAEAIIDYAERDEGALSFDKILSFTSFSKEEVSQEIQKLVSERRGDLDSKLKNYL